MLYFTSSIFSYNRINSNDECMVDIAGDRFVVDRCVRFV